MKRSAHVRNIAGLIASTVRWTHDPNDVGWFRAMVDGEPVYMRINDFPDENLYSVWLGDGWLDFDNLPPGWSVEFPPSGWPATARPALPKGEFHDS